MIKKYSEMKSNPTEDMHRHFETRTKYHIDLVNMFAQALKDKIPELPIEHIKSHDANKYLEPLRTPYIFLSWKYHKPSYKYPPGMEDKIVDATYLHVTTNPHHPEFWDKEHASKNKDDSRVDRDEIPDTIINATQMTNRALLEMCCDWSAVGWERSQKSPRDWADKNVNKRWKFTNKQVKFIYKLINIIETIIKESPDFLK